MTTERWYNSAKSVVFCCLEVEGENLIANWFVGEFDGVQDGK